MSKLPIVPKNLPDDVIARFLKTFETNIRLAQHPTYYLPPGVGRKHGCLTCEWYDSKDLKGRWKCRYREASDHPRTREGLASEFKGLGICSHRAYYLLNFCDDPLNVVNYVQWFAQYKTGLKELENQRDLSELDCLNNRISLLKDELVKAESDEYGEILISILRKDLRSLTRERSSLRSDWLELDDRIMKSIEKKLDRDHTKKIDITNRSIKPSDIAAALYDANRKIIDGELVDKSKDVVK